MSLVGMFPLSVIVAAFIALDRWSILKWRWWPVLSLCYKFSLGGGGLEETNPTYRCIFSWRMLHVQYATQANTLKTTYWHKNPSLGLIFGRPLLPNSGPESWLWCGHNRCSYHPCVTAHSVLIALVLICHWMPTWTWRIFNCLETCLQSQDITSPPITMACHSLAFYHRRKGTKCTWCHSTKC